MIAWAAAAVLACWAALALAYRREVVAAWQEPTLAAPVLIVESDDWGYGPVEQAEWLRRIADLLAAFRDAHGAHPVMTLGVVLAGPDTDRIRDDGARRYHRTTLAAPALAPVRAAMQDGARRGVFALQLHGMEHYWPDALLRAAQSSAPLRDWLTAAGMPSTEALPPPLQSRWIDAVALPSTPLPREAIAAAASEEVATFAAIFGRRPEVVVPPTFVWTDDVEAAWHAAGVATIVTPGRRYESRDRDGRPVPGTATRRNGATSAQGLVDVVRDDYFEPALGHTADRGLAALERKTRAGRPTLLEMHRMNFTGESAGAGRALGELRELLSRALALHPNLVFTDTATLARQWCEQGPLVEKRFAARLRAALARLAESPRLVKLAWATAAIVPAWIVWRMSARRG